MTPALAALITEAEAMIAEDDAALAGRTFYDGMPESHPAMRLMRRRDNRRALVEAVRAGRILERVIPCTLRAGWERLKAEMRDNATPPLDDICCPRVNSVRLV